MLQVARKRAQHKQELWAAFVPCECQNGCGADCPCYENSQFCGKFCACDRTCPHFFQGCVCTSGCRHKNCPCAAAGQSASCTQHTTCLVTVGLASFAGVQKLENWRVSFYVLKGSDPRLTALLDTPCDLSIPTFSCVQFSNTVGVDLRLKASRLAL